MTSVGVSSELRGVAADADAALAVAALQLARDLAGGAALWCVSPWEHHARHLAVEFVHPVLVGARAVPAVAVSSVDAPAALRTGARADDVVVLLGPGDDRQLVAIAAECPALGLRCVWLVVGPPPPADLGIVVVEAAPAERPDAAYDGTVVRTLHLLWELVHVCFDHLSPTVATPAPAGDSTGFLYPFLGEAVLDEDALFDDLAASGRAKQAASAELLGTTLAAAADDIDAAAEALVSAAQAGGRVLVAGNGGSAADAAGFVALLRRPPSGTPIGALCLAEDPTVLTALANDIGVGGIFARQVVAHGRPGDVVVAISTSGRSENILKAFAAARRVGLATVAVAGEGGRDLVATEAVDHVVVVRSDSVHRVQETQEAVLYEIWARAQRRLEEVGS